MRVFIKEVRRLLQWRMWLLFLPIAAILYIMNIEFHFQHFPNGSDAYYYETAENLVHEYGVEVTETNMAEFAEHHEQQLAAADTFIANHIDAIELDVNTYDELFASDIDERELPELRNTLMDSADGLFWYIQMERSILDQYHSDTEDPSYTAAANERIAESDARGEHRTILPAQVMDNFHSLLFNGSMLVLVAIVVFISPSFYRDHHVRPLQYVTKKGRRVFSVKLWAALFVGLLLATLILGILFAGYVVLNDTTYFWEASINSFMSPSFFWYDLSFQAYMLVSVAIVYSIVVLMVIMTSIVSRFAGSYLSLLGLLVPGTLLFIIFALRDIISFVFVVTDPLALPFFLSAGGLLLAAILFVYRTRREARIEIV
ncbi:hypothetical protein [Geomicrobium sp. JCM 19038]|uniref:hypothetical protein n=1 Tax=Geomicrobium sp. JCM 19038 TaxID=1460635 RepID=UPI00045F28AE|nr:hypothetical protein [Geomicrobium sp. JCM 19038]GAK08062.1 hypothetical protein JCM19038_1825 [Geomicrobium sp. JCM 19038]